jgi:hypothetical protein
MNDPQGIHETTQNAAIAMAEMAVKQDDEISVAILSTADSLEIKNAEEMAASGVMLQTIKGRQKALADARLSITRPMDAAKKRVMELFQPAVDRLAKAETTIKGAVLTYTREQERLRREAQAELDAAAERTRTQLIEQAETHDETGRHSRAETLRERADTVQAPTVAPAEVPRGAVHVRVTWKAEVTDLQALARAYAEGQRSVELILPNMPVLNELARTLKGDLTIPGVEAVAEEGVTARA